MKLSIDKCAVKCNFVRALWNCRSVSHSPRHPSLDSMTLSGIYICYCIDILSPTTEIFKIYPLTKAVFTQCSSTLFSQLLQQHSPKLERSTLSPSYSMGNCLSNSSAAHRKSGHRYDSENYCKHDRNSNSKCSHPSHKSKHRSTDTPNRRSARAPSSPNDNWRRVNYPLAHQNQ